MVFIRRADIINPNGGKPMIFTRKKDKQESEDEEDENPNFGLDSDDNKQDNSSIEESLAEIHIQLLEIKEKLNRLDGYVTIARNELEGTKQNNKVNESNIEKLLSLYEEISKKFNPTMNYIIENKEHAENINKLKSKSEILGQINQKTPWDQDLKEVLRVSPDMSDIGGVTIGEKITETVSIPTQQGGQYSTILNKLKDNSISENGKPILWEIQKNYSTTVLVMRWIEFMFERVKRDKISLLMDYYKDIGWISDEIKSLIMGYARGEIQDVLSYEEEEITTEPFQTNPLPIDYKQVNDWRLSAEDHLKSLLFIMKISGKDVDKDNLNSLEQEISSFKRSLEAYHGV